MSRPGAVFAGAAVCVLLLDQLSKLAAVAHLTPAVFADPDLGARRRALAQTSSVELARRAWSARHPCDERAEACPRQWLLPGVAALRYVENAGAALGDARSPASPVARAALVAASLAALGLCVLGARRAPRASLLLGAVAGGVLGNLSGRVARGYVIDVLELRALGVVAPVFNLADAAITGGLALLAARVATRHCRTGSGRVWRAPWHAAGRS